MHSVQLFDFLSNNGSGVVVLIVTFVTRVGSLDCPVRPRSRPVITVNRDNIVNRMACVSCTSHSLVWLHLLSLLFLPVLTRKLPTRFSASFFHFSRLAYQSVEVGSRRTIHSRALTLPWVSVAFCAHPQSLALSQYKMMLDNCQEPYDLSVPSLDTYFNPTGTVFASNNALFSGSAEDLENTLSHGHDVSSRNSSSPSSLHKVNSNTSEHIHSNSQSRGGGSTSSFSFAGLESLFYNGTPTSGNETSLYIQIPANENEGGVSCGSEFWVSARWDEILPKLLDIATVLDNVVKHINDRPDLKDKAVQILGCARGLADSGLRSDGTTDTNNMTNNDPFSVPNSATFSSFSTCTKASNQPFTFSDAGNLDSRATSVSAHTRPQNSTYWLTPPVRGDHINPFNMVSLLPVQEYHCRTQLKCRIFQQQQQHSLPTTPSTGRQPWDSTSGRPVDLTFKLPPMPAPAPGVHELISQHIHKNSSNSTAEPSGSDFGNEASAHNGSTVFTAQIDTIDPFLLAQADVSHNEETLEYVWSRSDSTLYKSESLQGQQAIMESGSIHLIFPPKTMLLSYEKDGSIATPAYSNLHPHSNEWLKNQVCHRSCPYRAGTASLKRPKTVREHFRKVCKISPSL